MPCACSDRPARPRPTTSRRRARGSRRCRWRRTAAEAAARSVMTTRGSAAKTSCRSAVQRAAVRLPGLRDARPRRRGRRRRVRAVRLGTACSLPPWPQPRAAATSRTMSARSSPTSPSGTGRRTLSRGGAAVARKPWGFVAAREGRRPRAAADSPRGPRRRPRRRPPGRRARRGARRPLRGTRPRERGRRRLRRGLLRLRRGAARRGVTDGPRLARGDVRRLRRRRGLRGRWPLA